MISAAPQELVSPATRRAFRELAPGSLTLAEIDGIWQDQRFAPGPENSQSGAQRSRYQQYLDAVDWVQPHPRPPRAARIRVHGPRD